MASCKLCGTLELTIRHYRQTKRMRFGEAIVSQNFTVDDRAWHIEFYPQGCSVFDWGWTALFVRMSAATDQLAVIDPVRTEFIFQLIDPDNGSRILHEHRPGEGPRYEDFGSGGWGTYRFMTRKQLERPDFGALRGDSLMVRCTVKFLPPPARRRVAGLVEVRVPSSCYADNAVRFLASGRAPFDVKFNVDGVVLEAHRLVLASQSPWFEGLLYGQWSETTANSDQDGAMVDITGTSREAFCAVLHYIYNDKLPDETTADEAATRELFQVADMFLLDRLKMMCASRLCDFIRDGTAMPESIMELAEKHSCVELQQACRNYFDRKGRGLPDTWKFPVDR